MLKIGSHIDKLHANAHGDWSPDELLWWPDRIYTCYEYTYEWPLSEYEYLLRILLLFYLLIV